jgi:hypothetical protein
LSTNEIGFGGEGAGSGCDDKSFGTPASSLCGRLRWAGVWRRKALTQNENLDSMAGMKAKTLVLTLAVWFAVGALCLAAAPQVGTWKLNEPKSKFTAGNGEEHHGRL